MKLLDFCRRAAQELLSGIMELTAQPKMQVAWSNSNRTELVTVVTPTLMSGNVPYTQNLSEMKHMAETISMGLSGDASNVLSFWVTGYGDLSRTIAAVRIDARLGDSIGVFDLSYPDGVRPAPKGIIEQLGHAHS